MRMRVFRLTALGLGLLGIPSLAVQVWRGWPPAEPAWSFCGLQAAVRFAFLSFGSGLGLLAVPRPTGGPPNEPDP